MKRHKSERRRRSNSSQSSSSSSSSAANNHPEELFKQLKSALVEHGDRSAASSVQQIIYKLQKNYKQNIGILRVGLPGGFNFNQGDMEEFFKRYGRVERIVLKQQNNSKLLPDQQPKKQTDSIAYIIYAEYCSALLALKVLESSPEKERIISVKICHSIPLSNEASLFSQPLINSRRTQDMTIEIEKDYEFGEIAKNYKYVGTIGLDLTDKEYRLKQRILGVDGCNFVRIYYICEKMFKFEHQEEQSRLQDLVLKLIINKSTGLEREVLILSHSLQKYNNAVRSLHQLLEQIVEEYKNSKEKLVQIIPKDVHIRKWEKFSVETQLKFLNI